MHLNEALDALRNGPQAQYCDSDHPIENTEQWKISTEVGGVIAEGFRDRVSFGTFYNTREWGSHSLPGTGRSAATSIATVMISM